MLEFATAFGPEPFTLDAASRVGLGRDLLRLLIGRGQVRRLLRGVYVDTAVPDGLELRARAAAKVVPDGSVVCARTAAWLWGIDALAMGSHRVLPRIDLMGAPGTSASRRAEVFGSTGPLATQDIVQLGGVLVTAPARTAADLARLLPRPDALASLDAMLRLPGLSLRDVQRVVDGFSGYRGVVQARELAQIADPRAESPQESRCRLRCIDAGFPAPEPQIEVFDDSQRFVARLDMGWLYLLKAVEFDGDDSHASAGQQQWDRVRRERAEGCGWGIAVVTTAHVLGRDLAFEQGIAELTGWEFRLTRNHPRYGGWDARSRWAAA